MKLNRILSVFIFIFFLYPLFSFAEDATQPEEAPPSEETLPVTNTEVEEVEIDLEALKSDTEEDDYYSQIPLYANAIALIKSRYIKDIPIRKLVQGSLRGMMAELDPYSEYLDEEKYARLMTETDGEYGGIGLVVGIRDGKLLVIAPMDGTPAYKAGIKSGDAIVKIDDTETHEISLTEAVAKLRGKPKSKVLITVRRNGEKELLEFKITRKLIELVSVRELMMLDEGIAYIRVIDFDSNVEEILKEEIKKVKKEKAKALILDLRNNPGGLLSSGVKVADFFLKKKTLIVFTRDREKKEHLRFEAEKKIFAPDIPLVVLINRGSASASEIVAGAIQDHERGLVIGEKSFGKGSVQMVVPFPDKTAIRITTDTYYTPNGNEIETIGITPDIEVASSPIGQKELLQDLDEKERLLLDSQVKTAVNVLKGILLTHEKK